MSSTKRFVLAALLVGCSSTGVGNPRQSSIELAVVADDDEPPERPADEPGSAGAGAGTEPDESLPDGSVQKAILVLRRITLLACDSLGESRVVWGPFEVNLLDGTTTPEIGPIADTSGGFCGFDAVLAPALNSSAALEGRSIHFEGVRADGVPFLLYADVRRTLRVRARGGRIWGSQSSEHMFWTLRPRRWARERDLVTIEPTELADGTRAAVIDFERHPVLARWFAAHIAGSSTLYADVNRDRVFDAEDRTEILGDGLDDSD